MVISMVLLRESTPVRFTIRSSHVHAQNVIILDIQAGDITPHGFQLFKKLILTSQRYTSISTFWRLFHDAFCIVNTKEYHSLVFSNEKSYPTSDLMSKNYSFVPLSGVDLIK